MYPLYNHFSLDNISTLLHHNPNITRPGIPMTRWCYGPGKNKISMLLSCGRRKYRSTRLGMVCGQRSIILSMLEMVMEERRSILSFIPSGEGRTSQSGQDAHVTLRSSYIQVPPMCSECALYDHPIGEANAMYTWLLDETQCQLKKCHTWELPITKL